MSESLKDYQDDEDRHGDELALVATMLSGVEEIAELVPVEILSDPFCKQTVELYRETHKKGEPTDIGRLATAAGTPHSIARYSEFCDRHAIAPEDAISIARVFRTRYEGVRAASVLRDNLAYLEFGFEASEAAARCQKALEEFQGAVSVGDGGCNVDSLLRQHGDRLFQSRQEGGMPFNLPTLDKHIGGLHAGELIVIAARPKKGKTSLLASIVEAANLRTIVFSLEMTSLEFLRMLVCIHGRIPADEIRERLRDLDAAKESLRRRSIDIIDMPGLTAAEISAACHARRGVRMVVVDYAQIIGKARGAESSRESLVDSIKSLKVLAKRLNATIIAGSQIARTGDDKPTARDLAESDEILRSADAVMVMNWKDDNPTPESKWNRTPVEVELALTHRHGPSGKFPMAFFRSQRRFGEWGAGDRDSL